MRENYIVDRSTSNNAQQPWGSLPASYDLAWIVLMLMVTLSAVVAQIYTYVPKPRRQRSSKTAQKNTACNRCQYFNNNLYLKCALHPSTVLTEDSNDCKDYCPKKLMK